MTAPAHAGMRFESRRETSWWIIRSCASSTSERNLGNKAFREDLPAVLARAHDAGVETVVVTGTSVPASRGAWEIAEAPRAPGRSPRLFATAGIHPHHASTFGSDALVALRELCARPRGGGGRRVRARLRSQFLAAGRSAALLRGAARAGGGAAAAGVPPRALGACRLRGDPGAPSVTPRGRRGALLHRHGRGAGALSRPRSARRHHGLDLRRAARNAPPRAGWGASRRTD